MTYDYHMDDDRDYIVPFECPFRVCDEITTAHFLCKRVAEKRIEAAQERLETVEDWWPDFLARWKFWEYQHPDTQRGDRAPAGTWLIRHLDLKIEEFFA